MSTRSVLTTAAVALVVVIAYDRYQASGTRPRMKVAA